MKLNGVDKKTITRALKSEYDAMTIRLTIGYFYFCRDKKKDNGLYELTIIKKDKTIMCSFSYKSFTPKIVISDINYQLLDI